jgi:hypothetical protein
MSLEFKVKRIDFIVLIFLLGFIFSHTALAAKQVEGEVPAYVPLQQAPIGVSPNVNNNVQFSDPSHEGQFDASGTLQTGTNTSLDDKNTGSHPELIFAESKNNSSETGGSKLWFVIGLILMVIIIAIFINRNGKE